MNNTNDLTASMEQETKSMDDYLKASWDRQAKEAKEFKELALAFGKGELLKGSNCINELRKQFEENLIKATFGRKYVYRTFTGSNEITGESSSSTTIYLKNKKTPGGGEAYVSYNRKDLCNWYVENLPANIRDRRIDEIFED